LLRIQTYISAINYQIYLYEIFVYKFIQKYWEFTLNLIYIALIMMSVKEFAKKRGVPKITVYKWIERGQEAQNGFKSKKISDYIVIEEIKPTK